MKHTVLPLFFLLISVFNLNGFAEKQNLANKSTNTAMRVVSVYVDKFQTPLLMGKEINPVLRIGIETSGKNQHLDLNELLIHVTGDNVKLDIQEISVLYSGDGSSPGIGALFGKTETLLNEVHIKGFQKLAEGKNIFLVCFKLKESANITGKIDASCVSVLIADKMIKPEVISDPGPFRLGIALRKHNDDNADTYRIPGLATTTMNTLIAVYDIRRNNATDLQEDIDIGMSLSRDGGTTWTPMKVIMDMGEWGGRPQDENGVGDPSVLVDRQTNTIWVAAVWAHGYPREGNWMASKPGLKPEETSQLMLIKSEDDGKSWSEPINITSQIKDPKWYLILQGPGKGITLMDGTLVFPAQFKDESQIPFSTIIYSKDHGKTWNIGTGALSNTTEAQVIELDDGHLMLNMRDNRNRTDDSENNGCSVYITSDLGKTWIKHPTSGKNILQESTCQASLIKENFMVNGKKQKVVFFSNPNTKKGRHHMTIKTSLDDGQTWPEEYQLLLDEKNGRGYSCMTKIDDFTIGILYEDSQADMTFQVIPVKEIINR